MADRTDLEQSLYEAALQGNVALLHDLLRRDPSLLHRLPSPSNTSPLNTACKLGHKSFVLELLGCNPNLAEELDPNDKSSILHLAARNGHLDLVTSLVSFNPSMCYARDIHGRTPIHVAAVKGQLHVVEQLLREMPTAGRERVGLLGGSSGDTIMHLCVKCNQLEALELTVRIVGDDEMLNATDANGNTILHIAVANKRLQIVQYLLRDRRVKRNTPNLKGWTAMDMLKESPRDVINNNNNNVVDDHRRLRLALKEAKVLGSGDIKNKGINEKQLVWFENQRSTLMVVASLIATMAFQAGVNPPGGLWQEDSTSQPISSSTNAPAPAPSDLYYAGLSIMAQEDPYHYTKILVCNTLGFILSMTSILLLISGLPCRRLFMALVMVTLWVALSAMSLSYLFSAIALLPDEYLDTEERSVFKIVAFVVFLWVCVMGLLLLGHVFRWTFRFIKHLCKCGFPEST